MAIGLSISLNAPSLETPHHILNARKEQCRNCPKPCQYQSNEVFLKEGENACPQGRFIAYQTFQRQQFQGAGDLVAAIAQPIAGAVDKVLKTKVKGCAACAKRRQMLNQLIPFKPKS